MKVVIFGLFIILSGCASLSGLRSENRANIMSLSPGMDKSEVTKIMGNESYSTIAGTISNPYRSELYRTQVGIVEVLMYYTDLKASDDAITDDELTPVVLIDGKVDGWGWTYWDNMVHKYEIRIR